MAQSETQESKVWYATHAPATGPGATPDSINVYAREDGTEVECTMVHLTEEAAQEQVRRVPGSTYLGKVTRWVRFDPRHRVFTDKWQRYMDRL
jgi:hypothetical protein